MASAAYLQRPLVSWRDWLVDSVKRAAGGSPRSAAVDNARTGPAEAHLKDGLGGAGPVFDYPVTVSDCVDTGPAPSPGNADPTPLNITSVTV